MSLLGICRHKREALGGGKRLLKGAESTAEQVKFEIQGRRSNRSNGRQKRPTGLACCRACGIRGITDLRLWGSTR